MKKSHHLMTFLRILVREMRIELTLGYQYAPQTYASTNSATRAILLLDNSMKNINKRQEYLLFFFSFWFWFFIKDVFSGEVIEHKTNESFDTKRNEICPEDKLGKEFNTIGFD